MDAILNGILSSQHPDALKKQLITKVTENSSKPQPVRVIRSVLQISSSWFLQGESDIALSEGLQVYKAWAKYNLTTFEAFFDREFLLSLFSFKGKREANAMILLDISMELLQRSSSYSAHVRVVEAKAISYVREHPSIDCLTNFVNFLFKFNECLPKGDFVSTFCVSLINSLSLCAIPEDSASVIQYIKNVDRICSLIHTLWNNADSDVIMESLKAIFGIIAAEETEPSLCLGAVVRNIPEKMIEIIVKYAINSDIDNMRMTTALQRVVDWVQWPTATNVHLWIITFFKSLAAAKKYSILINVTETKIEQVCQKLEFAAVREGALSVLTHMLLGFQHSPEPFHKILPDLVRVAEVMKKEDEVLLKQLSDLLHCCVFLHAGYPDLYDPILEVLKGIPPLSSEEIKSRLEESQWLTQNSGASKYVSKVTQRSDTGKTGLFNLGNTCFMNSIIQALFMCDSFRRDTLSYQPTPEQPVMAQLQQVFAFLSQTQRPAYAPMTFSRMSRPSWFVAGHQQDCSEYLKYLLDQVHEQERSRQKKEKCGGSKNNDGGDQPDRETAESMEGNDNSAVIQDNSAVIRSLIEDHYGGLMVTTVTCLNCKSQSSRKEEFNDIPLAFPEYKPIVTKEIGGGKEETEPPTKCLHLNDLLQHYLKPELLTGDNRYFCENCGSLQDGERKISIAHPPEHLIISLLRFSYDAKIHARSKIFQEVKYPRTLILPKEQPSETKGDNPRRSLRSAVSRQIERCGVNTQKGEVYGLNAVVVHSGTSSESGHYYTYARHSLFQDPERVMENLSECTDEDTIDFLQDKWYLFNDNRVSYAQYSSFCSVTQRFTKDTAYVLFYKRIDPQNSEKEGVDLNRSIKPAEVDPPLQDRLRQLVNKDNAQYLQEQELSEQKRASRKRPVSQSTSSWFYKQDEDQGPPGSCGGSSGFDNSGPRFVF